MITRRAPSVLAARTSTPQAPGPEPTSAGPSCPAPRAAAWTRWRAMLPTQYVPGSAC
jgi:hypothetical protein